MRDVRTTRLGAGERELARRMFSVMAEVFGEAGAPLTDSYIDRLLTREDFWAIAAVYGDDVVGGVTAHTLPMTRAEGSEIFIYDVAVQPGFQRRGIGRRLMEELREAASRHECRKKHQQHERHEKSASHGSSFYCCESD